MSQRLASLTVGVLIVSGALCVASDERAKQDIDSTVTVTGRVLSAETGKPLPGAVIRAAVPATDMRDIRTRPNDIQYEATTDAHGEYQLSIPTTNSFVVASLDAFVPGFRSWAGTHYAGGDSSRFGDVTLSPERTAAYDFKLGEAVYAAGVLVDSAGNPIQGAQITATLEEPKSIAYVTVVSSGKDGRFQVFDYPLGGLQGRQGKLVFEHPNYSRTTVDNIYALADAQRRGLRITMTTGKSVSGRLLDTEGKPVPDVMIEATFAQENKRKATVTDRAGHFSLLGLPEGQCTLVAHAKSLHEKAKQSLELNRDYSDLTLQMTSVGAQHQSTLISVLGMKLVDVDPEVEDTYDLWLHAGALVSNPGEHHEHFGIGTLVEGDCFWIVGDETKVTDVKSFVSELLRNVRREPDGSGTCRVVYTYKRAQSAGTNTQYMKLSAEDLKDLEATAKQLAANQDTN